VENIYQKIDHYLHEGQRVVLARIIRQAGSSPRTLGTACLVAESGRLTGTIGGGRLEFEVLTRAQGVLKNGRSTLLPFQMTGDEVAASEMICGGTVDVYLEPVFPGNETARDIFNHLALLSGQGHAGTLVTRIAEGIDWTDTGCRMLMEPGGKITGRIDAPADLKQRVLYPGGDGQAVLVKSEKTDAAFFVEPIRPDDVLYLFGAGHVSRCVAGIAETVGFSVVVVDDRAEFASRDRFPHAVDIVAIPFTTAFEQIHVAASAYIVIVTRGHSHDRDVLRWALTQPVSYLGMIGSRRKREIIYRSLMDEGVAADRLARVHSPIGLSIGAQTPEEIAVSIVAELIAVRAAQRNPEQGEKSAIDG